MAPLTEPEEDIGTSQRLRERARGGLGGMRGLPLVHALGATLVDHALGVAEDNVAGREPDRLEQLEAGDAGSAGAITDELGRFDVTASEVKSIDQSGCGDDGSAVLVVMKDGNIEEFAQPLLDNEAFWRPDILEIDAAPALPQKLDAVDDFIRVLGRYFEIDGIDVGKALEQH
jgi:hypothetical protein